MSTLSVNNLLNVIATPTSLVVGTATNNPLILQTNNVIAATVDTNQNVALSSTGFLGLSKGTTAQRPGVPISGALRFNTSLVQLELYNGSSWVSSSIGFSSGSGAPSGTTPVSPPFYVDVSTTPRSLYLYAVGSWNLVTPPTASQTTFGISRLATAAEAIAQAATALTISPATLKASVNSNYFGVLSQASAFSATVNLDCVRYSNGAFTKALAGASPGNLAVGFVDLANLTMVTSGILSGFTGLVPDSAYFLSGSVPGGITLTAPTDAVRVGTAVSATQLLVRVSSGAASVAAAGIGGSSGNIAKAISQTAHGFAIGNWLYHNGTSYQLARSDAEATVESVGIVGAVADANNFTLVSSGFVAGLAGLTAGRVHRISPTISGAVQIAVPTAVTHLDKPVFIADTSSSGYVILMRANPVAAVAASAVSNTPAGNLVSTNIQSTVNELDQKKLGTYVLNAGANLDTVVISGVYRLGTGHVNVPAGPATMVDDSQMLVVRSGNSIAQTIVTYDTGRSFTRGGAPANIGGAYSWSAWREALGNTVLPPNTDLNLVVTSGVYRLLTGVINGPPGAVATDSQMLVMRNIDTVAQIIVIYTSGRTFTRGGSPSNIGGTTGWSTWNESFVAATSVLPIASGGTNSTTPSAARIALGAAASGANTDISSMSGNAATATTAASCSGNSATATTATTALNPIGVGQTWQGATRGINIVYTNTTGKTIQAVGWFVLAPNNYAYIGIQRPDTTIGIIMQAQNQGTFTGAYSLALIVPPGGSYMFLQSVSGDGAGLYFAYELR